MSHCTRMVNIKQNTQIPFRVWMAWIVIVLFYAYQYILRVIPNVLLPYMQETFAVDSVVFGQFSGVYYTGYALAHLPLGFLVSRYGLKKILPWCVALSALGLWPVIYADTWTARLAGRVITGVGSSFSPIAAFYLLSNFYPKEKFTKFFSILLSIGLLAAIYGGAPLAHLINVFGCKTVINILMIVGVTFAGVTLLILPHEEKNLEVGKSVVGKIVTNPKILLIGLASGLMIGTLEGFPDAWGVTFLNSKYGLNTVDAAKLTSLIFVGMFVGCPLCSWLASRKHQYFQTISAVGAIMVFCFSMLLLAKDLPYPLLSTLFIITGVCCGFQVPALYTGSIFVKQRRASSMGSTVVNMIMMSFGHIIHTIVGFSINCLGGLESLSALNKGLWIIPLAGTFGFLIFYYLYKTTKVS